MNPCICWKELKDIELINMITTNLFCFLYKTPNFTSLFYSAFQNTCSNLEGCLDFLETHQIKNLFFWSLAGIVWATSLFISYLNWHNLSFFNVLVIEFTILWFWVLPFIMNKSSWRKVCAALFLYYVRAWDTPAGARTNEDEHNQRLHETRNTGKRQAGQQREAWAQDMQQPAVGVV